MSDDETLLRDAPAEEYAGPAVVTDPGAEVPTAGGVSTGSTTGEGSTTGVAVEVDLRGQFEPLDGRFHWYGRIAVSEELTERFRSGTTVHLSTPRGSAAGRLSDVDPWGRFRISGTGRPPF